MLAEAEPNFLGRSVRSRSRHLHVRKPNWGASVGSPQTEKVGSFLLAMAERLPERTLDRLDFSISR
jgi:hypothetical protein